MFYRQKENKIISKILDHSGGVFSSGHGWGILGGRQGLSLNTKWKIVPKQKNFLFSLHFLI
jgi:hypothetical protein